MAERQIAWTAPLNPVVPASGTVPYVNFTEIEEGMRVTVRDASGKVAAYVVPTDAWAKLKEQF